MTKKLDIKRLAKGMSLQDKAKLLFADINRKVETSGLERVLTPEERNAIIEDARKHNQLGELNRLNNLYKLANLLLADIQTQHLNFKIAFITLMGSLISMFFKETALDLFNEIISDVAKTENERKELEKKYTEKYQNLLMIEKKGSLSLIKLPELLKETAERAKKYKIVNYQLDYVVNELAGIDFLSDKQKERLKNYENHIKEDFLSQKEIWSIFENIDKEECIEKEFFEAFYHKEEIKQIVEVAKDIDKAIELTAEDKRKAREQIDDLLNRANI